MTTTISPTFSDLGVDAAIVKRLAKRGIETPFEIQSLVIPDAVGGRDILGKAKTGSGKTLAFGIPAVQRMDDREGTQIVVLVPTRELCSQVTDDMKSIAPSKTKILAVYGGVKLGPHIEKAPHAQIIVATPGRLIDLLERRAANLRNTHVLVIDEADRMADMGFLPQVARILKALPKEGRQTMLFSATLDSQIMGLISQTRDPIRFEVEEEQPTVEGVEHHLFEVHQVDKTEVLTSLLQGPHGLTLVFTRTKRMCDWLADQLKGAGVKAEPIHGDLGQGDRERALRRFEQGEIDVLVATDVAARGLDIQNITLVVNYDPPEDHKAYLHRVGRTARAGRSGTAVTLATWQERSDVEKMARMLKLQPHIVEMFSSDPRLQQVGTDEFEGNQPAKDDPNRPAAAGAYARLARRPGGRGRRR